MCINPMRIFPDLGGPPIPLCNFLDQQNTEWCDNELVATRRSEPYYDHIQTPSRPVLNPSLTS